MAVTYPKSMPAWKDSSILRRLWATYSAAILLECGDSAPTVSMRILIMVQS
ncbi:hypothetical protein O9992_04550 [Vibrio lentus]|nr:hypothetical protein [Vibrio lentus]